MKSNNGFKAGDLRSNHNEKQEGEEKSKNLKNLKNLKTKLRLNKETIRELKNSHLKMVAGGAITPTYNCATWERDCY